MDIDDALKNKSVELIPRPIMFHKAKNNKMRLPFDKFVALNARKPARNANGESKVGMQSFQTKVARSRENLPPKPTRYLYPPEKVSELFEETGGWVRGVGTGLQNMGNTCFLNSVLQALMYTRPLIRFLQQRHADTSRSPHQQKGVRTPGNKRRSHGPIDLLGELAKLKMRTINSRHWALPKRIVKALPILNRRFRPGRQEDAHEFLRYTIQHLQGQSLRELSEGKGVLKSLGEPEKRTSPIYQIFGGLLTSEVTCTECRLVSRTFDPFLDLSLQVENCSSLQKALRFFTKIERLDGDNKYKCKRCNKSVVATKQFKIQQAPGVLCLHLKRFRFTMIGHSKINKHVQFNSTLTLNSQLSNDERQPKYELTSVVCHHGSGARSGHYTAFVKPSDGAWRKMDDSLVSLVRERTVLQSQAYILLYTMKKHTPLQTPPRSPYRASAVPPLSLPPRRETKAHRKKKRNTSSLESLFLPKVKGRANGSHENHSINGVNSALSAKGGLKTPKLSSEDSSDKGEIYSRGAYQQLLASLKNSPKRSPKRSPKKLPKKSPEKGARCTAAKDVNSMDHIKLPPAQVLEKKKYMSSNGIRTVGKKKADVTNLSKNIASRSPIASRIRSRSRRYLFESASPRYMGLAIAMKTKQKRRESRRLKGLLAESPMAFKPRSRSAETKKALTDRKMITNRKTRRSLLMSIKSIKDNKINEKKKLTPSMPKRATGFEKDIRNDWDRVSHQRRTRGTYMAQVGQWATVDTRQQSKNQELSSAFEPVTKKRDDWDVHLDKGRTKKVKRKRAQSVGSNAFQTHQNKRNLRRRTSYQPR
ncbi:hypothetical protein AAMO2058_000263700 [Amorphochlora amoebiformis]